MFSWGRQNSGLTPAGAAASSIAGSVSGNNTRSSTIVPQPFTRQEHLQSYLTDATLRPSTRRVSGDDTTYDTVFQTKSRHALILRVHLPSPVASQSRPAFTLVGVRATHLWLDRKMRVVGFSPILSDAQWAQSRLTLGDAVNKVVKHLQLHPPDVIEITDESLKRLQASLPQRIAAHQQRPSHAAAEGSNGSSGVYVPNRQAEAPSAVEEDRHFPVNLPPVPRSFPELNAMSKTEMRELLDDEDTFKAYVDKMVSVTAVKDLMGSIFAGNVETSKSNIKKKDELEALHSECESLGHSLKEKIASFQVLETKRNALIEPMDALTAISLLRKGKKQLFDESEDMADQFISGDSDLSTNDFVEEFMKLRTIHHERAAKMERLQHSP